MLNQTDIFEYLKDDDVIHVPCKLIVSVIIKIDRFKRLDLDFNNTKDMNDFIDKLDIVSIKDSSISNNNAILKIALVNKNSFINKYMQRNKTWSIF